MATNRAPGQPPERRIKLGGGKTVGSGDGRATSGRARSADGSGIHAARKRSDRLLGDPAYDAPAGVPFAAGPYIDRVVPVIGAGQRWKSNVAPLRETMADPGRDMSSNGVGFELVNGRRDRDE